VCLFEIDCNARSYDLGERSLIAAFLLDLNVSVSDSRRVKP
jgi:hypothetical protein